MLLLTVTSLYSPISIMASPELALVTVLSLLFLGQVSFAETVNEQIKVCQTFGSGVVEPFRGIPFHLSTTCPTTLLHFIHKDVEYKIIITHSLKTGLIKKVEFILNKLITVVTDGMITVEDKSVSLPYDHMYKHIHPYGIYTKLKSKILELSVIWRFAGSEIDYLWVELSESNIEEKDALCWQGGTSENVDISPSRFIYKTEECQTRTSITLGMSCKFLSHFYGCFIENDDIPNPFQKYSSLCKANIYYYENTKTLECAFYSAIKRYCDMETYEPGWKASKCPKPTCPGDLIYMEQGNPFTPTCSHPNFINSENTVETCVCPAGKVLNNFENSSRCIPKEECPCVYGGKIFAQGENRMTKCQSCTCENGAWTCIKENCQKRCIIEGGSVTTYDGKQYMLPKACTYVASQGLNWTIIIELSEDLFLGKVILQIEQKTYTFSKDSVKFENEEILELHLTEHVMVFWQSSMYVQVQTSFGMKIQVQVKPKVQLYVTLPKSESGKVKGLCGNHNDDTRDDFIGRSEIRESVAEYFALSWVMGTCNSKTPGICNSDVDKYAHQDCSYLMDPSGIFASCHNEVPSEDYVKACEKIVCNCEGNKDCLCVALGNYAKACLNQGIDVGDWRNTTSCVEPCNSGQMFSYDARSCNSTCQSLAGPDPACDVHDAPVEGCGCPHGSLLNSDGTCTTRSECQCYYLGKTLKPGNHFIGKTKCNCKDGKLDCPEPLGCSHGKTYVNCYNSSINTVNRKCASLGMPEIMSTICESGCYCPDGQYEDHNGTCVAPADCPCLFSGVAYKSGETVTYDCQACTCKGGLWACVEEACSGNCEVFGNGHYKTFDSKWYNFDGNCEYTLVEDDCGSGHRTFSIRAESVPCCEERLTCSRRITLELQGKDTLNLHDLEVGQIGNDTQLLYSVHTVGLYFEIRIPSLDITLTWDKHTRLIITLGKRWKNKVCGLCGNFNNNEQDDLQIRGSKEKTDALTSGNSWKMPVPQCSDATEVQFNCVHFSYCANWAERRCKIISSDIFTACHQKVDYIPYYKACVEESCSCSADQASHGFCTAVAAFAEACCEAGVTVNWRTPERCPIYCDYYNEQNPQSSDATWHYKSCGPLDIKICGKNYISRKLEGCYPTCPEDFPYFDENTKKCSKTCTTTTVSPTTTTESTTTVTEPPTTTTESTTVSPTTVTESTATPTVTPTIATTITTIRSTITPTITSTPSTESTTTVTEPPTTTTESTTVSPTTVTESTATPTVTPTTATTITTVGSTITPTITSTPSTESTTTVTEPPTTTTGSTTVSPTTATTITTIRSTITPTITSTESTTAVTEPITTTTESTTVSPTTVTESTATPTVTPTTATTITTIRSTITPTITSTPSTESTTTVTEPPTTTTESTTVSPTTVTESTATPTVTPTTATTITTIRSTITPTITSTESTESTTTVTEPPTTTTESTTVSPTTVTESTATPTVTPITATTITTVGSTITPTITSTPSTESTTTVTEPPTTTTESTTVSPTTVTESTATPTVTPTTATTITTVGSTITPTITSTESTESTTTVTEPPTTTTESTTVSPTTVTESTATPTVTPTTATTITTIGSTITPTSTSTPSTESTTTVTEPPTTTTGSTTVSPTTVTESTATPTVTPTTATTITTVGSTITPTITSTPSTESTTTVTEPPTTTTGSTTVSPTTVTESTATPTVTPTTATTITTIGSTITPTITSTPSTESTTTVTEPPTTTTESTTVSPTTVTESTATPTVTPTTATTITTIRSTITPTITSTESTESTTTVTEPPTTTTESTTVSPTTVTESTATPTVTPITATTITTVGSTITPTITSTPSTESTTTVTEPPTTTTESTTVSPTTVTESTATPTVTPTTATTITTVGSTITPTITSTESTESTTTVTEPPTTTTESTTVSPTTVTESTATPTVTPTTATTITTIGSTITPTSTSTPSTESTTTVTEPPTTTTGSTTVSPTTVTESTATPTVTPTTATTITTVGSTITPTITSTPSTESTTTVTEPPTTTTGSTTVSPTTVTESTATPTVTPTTATTITTIGSTITPTITSTPSTESTTTVTEPPTTTTGSTTVSPTTVTESTATPTVTPTTATTITTVGSTITPTITSTPSTESTTTVTEPPTTTTESTTVSPTTVTESTATPTVTPTTATTITTIGSTITPTITSTPSTESTTAVTEPPTTTTGSTTVSPTTVTESTATPTVSPTTATTVTTIRSTITPTITSTESTESTTTVTEPPTTTTESTTVSPTTVTESTATPTVTPITATTITTVGSTITPTITSTPSTESTTTVTEPPTTKTESTTVSPTTVTETTATPTVTPTTATTITTIGSTITPTITSTPSTESTTTVTEPPTTTTGSTTVSPTTVTESTATPTVTPTTATTITTVGSTITPTITSTPSTESTTTVTQPPTTTTESTTVSPTTVTESTATPTVTPTTATTITTIGSTITPTITSTPSTESTTTVTEPPTTTTGSTTVSPTTVTESTATPTVSPTTATTITTVGSTITPTITSTPSTESTTTVTEPPTTTTESTTVSPTTVTESTTTPTVTSASTTESTTVSPTTVTESTTTPTVTPTTATTVTTIVSTITPTITSTTTESATTTVVCFCRDEKNLRNWSCGQTWTENCIQYACNNRTIFQDKVSCPPEVKPDCPNGKLTSVPTDDCCQTWKCVYCSCWDETKLRNRTCGQTWTENCIQYTCNNGTIFQNKVSCSPEVTPDCPNGKMRSVRTDDCCQTWECDCQCQVYGDPHYITFDGTPYDFLEDCSYILVEEKKQKHNFSVIVDNFNCVANASCVRAVRVQYGKNIITLSIVSNRLIVSEFNNVNVPQPYENQGIRITTTNWKVSIYIDAIRSYVSLTPRRVLVVNLAMAYFHGNTQGQCGECGGGACVRRNGDVEPDTCCDKTAYSWLYEEKEKPHCKVKDVSCNTTITVPQCYSKRVPLCELFNHKAFKECSKKVDLTLLKKNCLFDSCMAKNNSIDCEVLEKAASDCQNAGFCVDWRPLTNGSCDVKCPEGMIYKECPSTPTTICEGGRISTKIMDTPTAGCFCPGNKHRAGGYTHTCVSDCTDCVGPHGEPKEPGDVWEANCYLCTCDKITLTQRCEPKTRSSLPTCQDNETLVRFNSTGCCNMAVCVEKTCEHRGHTYKIGERWSDSAQPCVLYSCEISGITIENKLCAEEQCLEGSRVCDKQKGCYTCKTCSPRMSRVNVTIDGKCTDEVELPVCEGQCTSHSRWNDSELRMEKECQCCQEKTSQEKSITLKCKGGSKNTFTYKHIVDCECQLCH
ncbi:mucin-2-like isoform X2 [Anguilla anguilla]|uniref:mucin-2-like isoform X2 n=1 Tax=Anguilla anguilla TaxID=7936 RepID=UPI0015AA085E|nr:mucin-2-like isoform X2 [Anguilla anguilla]